MVDLSRVYIDRNFVHINRNLPIYRGQQARYTALARDEIKQVKKWSKRLLSFCTGPALCKILALRKALTSCTQRGDMASHPISIPIFLTSVLSYVDAPTEICLHKQRCLLSLFLKSVCM